MRALRTEAFGRGLVGLVIGCAVAAAALSACSREDITAVDGSGEHVHTAEAITTQECVLCGMTIRAQPAPRAQVVHRDGTRVLLCSISELRDYLKVPSPHGKAAGVWVEALPADWVKPEIGAVPVDVVLPWVSADSAVYVIGVDVPGVMGEPVLAFADAGVAEAVRARHDGSAIRWPALTER